MNDVEERDDRSVWEKFNDWMYVHFYTIILWVVVVVVGVVICFGGYWYYTYDIHNKGKYTYRDSDQHFYDYYPSDGSKVHSPDCTCQTLGRRR